MAKKKIPQQQESTKPQASRPTHQAVPQRPVVTKAGSLAAYRPATWFGPDDVSLRKIYMGIAALGLLVMLFMAMGSGINADEKFQYSYSEKLLNYYTTFGKDTSALNVPEGIMHIYGGFFEITTSAVSKVLGFSQSDAGFYHVRHLFSATLGWLAIVFAGLLAYRIAGWRAGIITLVLLLLSPRFIGESLMNPKDVPFAAGYSIALYCFVRLLQTLESPQRKHLIGLAIGIMIALGTRAGGLLLFGYMGLFGLVDMYVRNRAGASVPFMSYLKWIGLPAIGGYILAVLFWPYALQNPLTNPYAALTKFAQYEIGIRVLFEGNNIMSDTVPWNYTMKWMSLTIPLVVIAGFLGGIALLWKLIRKYQPVPVLLVLFGAIFPVAYVIYSKSNLYDGWRHFTFVYPCIVILASLFWNELTQMFSSQNAVKYAIYGAMALLTADAAWYLAANSKIPYTYFNPIAGGTAGAVGQFETDYWGVSIRQGVEWLEQQGILNDHMDKPVVIATNMHFPLLKHTAKYGDKVIAKYLKYDKRCDDAWDYALYPTRFISGETLRQGNWPPDNAMHIIKAGGAPILAILKDNGKNCALGMASFKTGDYTTAIDYLKKEVENVPDNEIAWGYLSSSYLNSGKMDEAKAAAEKTISLSPNDMQGNNLLGMYYLQMRQTPAAKAQFANAVKKEPQNATAYYYLAAIAQGEGDNNTALAHLDKCIKNAPRFEAAYDLAASIYENMGDAQRAAQIRQAMQSLNKPQ